MDKILITSCFVLMILAKHSVRGFEAPRIVEHPKDTVIPRHDPVTLNCKAEGSPRPTISWYKDNKLLKVDASGNRIIMPGGGLFFLKVVNSRKEADSGRYYCEAKNEFGVARSSTATLQVAVLKDEFRKEPQNTQKAQGDTAILECSPPRGLPEPNVVWKKNGIKLDLDGSRRIKVVDNSNLVIQDIRQTDEGSYQCIARNVAGNRESTAAFLKVHVKPILVRGPQNQTVVEGKTVIFQCHVQGDPIPDVLWLRSAAGGNMPLDRVHILEDRSLRLENVTVEDSGQYSCEAENAAGRITASGMLNVHTLPTLSVRPIPKVIEAPSEVSFECKSTAQPSPILFWSIEGNNTLIFPPNRFGRFETTMSPEGTSVLTIPATTKSDNGLKIVCNAINDVGSISVRARLTVQSSAERPPPIIHFGPSNQTLPVKSVVVLPCRATGDPKPIISWYLDGNPVSNNQRTNITSSGSLVISELDKTTDSGIYTCVASSRNGKYTWSGSLKLDSPTNPNAKFYRSPDIQSFPSSPGKPLITNVTENSITISWIPSTKSGQSDIIGYTVEVFSTDNSKGWITAAKNLQTFTYTHKSVDKDYVYMFIVRAENELGLGPPSPVSEVVSISKEMNIENDVNFSEAYTTLTSGNIVTLLEANSTDANTVRLVWEIINAKFVEGFYIYSCKANTHGSYKVLTVLHGGGSSSCTISSLEKYTLYNFFLIPFYKNIEGRPSNAKQTYTLEDVPHSPPTNMEAILINASAVFVKWNPPPNDTLNGLLRGYDVIIRGYDSNNLSRILTNMTVDKESPKILLTNLTAGVTYSVSVAAATRMGFGPYTTPSMLRLDPNTKKLDLGYTRYPIQRDYSDDIITQTWFIILLGSIIAIAVFLFCATIIFKRIQYMKHNSLTNIHGNIAVGTVRKFPTLPLNENGVFIDHTGGIWRQASEVGNISGSSCLKDSSDYAQVPLPDYERLSPTTMPDYTMPDYAEVAGCSSFKSLNSPKYETYGAYATTSLIQNNYRNNKNTYSAPNSIHYSNYLNSQQAQYTDVSSNNQVKIYENKLENLLNLNNLNSPAAITPVYNQLADPGVRGSPKIGSNKRIKVKNTSKNSINNLTSYNEETVEQPLCIRSNGTWSPTSTSPPPNSNNEFSYQNPLSQSYPLKNLSDNNHKNNSQSYLSSFGKVDKV